MKRSGFTLLELLAAIGILAVLLAIIIPSLRFGRKHSQTLICTNQVRQIGLSAILYHQDHSFFPSGFFPSLGLAQDQKLGNDSYDPSGEWWMQRLSIWENRFKYERNLFWCPSRNRMNFPNEGTILCSNYGVNYSICKFFSKTPQTEFEGLPLRSNQIKNPSRTLLVMDSGYALIGWKAALPTLPVSFENNNRAGSFYLPGLEFNSMRVSLATPDKIHPEQRQDAVWGRHPGRTVNIGFADGHAQKEKAARLTVEENGEGKRFCVYDWSWE